MCTIAARRHEKKGIFLASFFMQYLNGLIRDQTLAPKTGRSSTNASDQFLIILKSMCATATNQRHPLKPGTDPKHTQACIGLHWVILA